MRNRIKLQLVASAIGLLMMIGSTAVFAQPKDPDESFRLIDDHYRPRLIRFFARRGFSADLREDLTQDVFERVFKSMANFHGGDSVEAFNTWLFKIADNIGRDYLRSRMTKKRDGQTLSLDGGSDDDETQTLPIDPPDPSQTSEPLDALIDQEQRRRLKEAVMKLPEKMGQCMQFHLYQELSNPEIAIAMRISVETVKAHLREGRAKLRAMGIFD